MIIKQVIVVIDIVADRFQSVLYFSSYDQSYLTFSFIRTCN